MWTCSYRNIGLTLLVSPENAGKTLYRDYCFYGVRVMSCVKSQPMRKTETLTALYYRKKVSY